VAEAAGLHYALADDRRDASPGGPPLVLIHGAGGSRLQWPAELRRLPGQAVYTLDLPGHGRSKGTGESTIEGYVARLGAWADRIHLGAAVLVGHSMGGAIALLSALAEPERVAALVLIGSGARLRVHPTILEMTASGRNLGEAVELVIGWAFGPKVGAALARQTTERMAEIPAAVLHADFSACDRFDVMDRLGETRAPTLVLCGQDDRLTPLKYSQTLAQNIRGSRLIVIEDAGHMVMLEQPGLVAQAVSSFLATAFPRG
jgi:pimeloyl-ACP methyl ester carboxylesterase